jgi:hypothetical protein
MPPAWWRRCGSPDRLELVTETMRATPEALAAAAPEWLVALAPADWYQRYAAAGQRLPAPATPDRPRRAGGDPGN